MSGLLHPNTRLVAAVATELKGHLEDFVLVGGCAVNFLLTEQARPGIRPTKDVDLVVHVASLADYYVSSKGLRAAGFKEDGEVFCRWRKHDLIVDLMPDDEAILGHSNRWYRAGLSHAERATLANGLQLRHVSAPYFIAAKLDSYRSRGEGDPLHHDIEDVVAVVDGRAACVDEVLAAEVKVCDFVRGEIEDLLASPGFVDAIPGMFLPDKIEQQRVPHLVGRLRLLAGV